VKRTLIKKAALRRLLSDYISDFLHKLSDRQNQVAFKGVAKKVEKIG